MILDSRFLLHSYTDLMHRPLSAFLAIVILGTPSLVLAGDAAVEAAARTRVEAELNCTKQVPELVGDCLRDKMKAATLLKKRFSEEQRKRTKQWHLENDKLGVSEEYRLALMAFQKTLAEERMAYTAALTTKMRAMEAQRKGIVATSQKIGESQVRPVRTGAESRGDCRRGDREERLACLKTLRKNAALDK